MQALGPDHYRRLERLARAYRREHAPEYEATRRANPRLEVDALCFQRLEDELLGVLVTPCSLSLVLVAPSPGQPPAGGSDRRIVCLPGGRYAFVRECLESEDDCLWRCEVLDDLSALEGRGEAGRLAQRLMQCVMMPDEPSSGSAGT
ncbi:MAG: [NiFe]-hydrogenase assembly chaperone HybE [Halomonas sp.]|nr:[NiFe]-hydrogenase assembly chaperone HybE [Halomonas sp.]